MNWINKKLGFELPIDEVDDHSFNILLSDTSSVLIKPNQSLTFSELKFSDSDEVISLDFFIPTFYYTKAIILDIPVMGRALIIESSNSNIKRNMSNINSVSIITLSKTAKRVFSFSSFISGINGLVIKEDRLEARILECVDVDEEREAFIVCLYRFALSEGGFKKVEQNAKSYFYEVESGMLVEGACKNCRELNYPFVENKW